MSACVRLRSGHSDWMLIRADLVVNGNRNLSLGMSSTLIDRGRIIFVPGKKRSGRNVRIIIFVPVYTVIFVPVMVQCMLNC